jgi:peptidoglycan/xylan/chitin deacetylase (PgdA/CDA1 family)
MTAERWQRSLPVLTFHAIDDVRSPVCTTPAGLRRYLESLAARGWRTLTLHQALHGHARGQWPARTFVLTFDDGYRSVLEHAAPVVAALRFTATIFVASDLVGGTMRRYGAPAGTPAAPLLDWPALRTLADAGWTIGSHSRTHAMLTALSQTEAERELVESKRAIEARLGAAVDACAYPYGATNAAVEAVAARHYLAGFGTRLAPVTPVSRLTRLERIDAYYLRRFSMVDRLDTAAGSVYLALRRLARGGLDRIGSRRYTS